MLLAFFKWCEASWMGKTISGSVYLFPVVEAVHLLALAVIGGAVLIVDMRLLGLGLRKTSVAALARDAQPWVTGSLIVMIVSGVCLFASEATKCYESTAFWIKISALIVVMIFTYTVRRKVALADEHGVSALTQKCVALVSVSLWFTVAWGGRWIGFGG